MSTARTLHGEEARQARATACEWMERAPAWLRAAAAVDVAADSDGALCVGVWEGERLCALLTFTELAPGVYEAHLDAVRGTDPAMLGRMERRLVDRLFEEGARAVFAWVLKPNRSVRSILEAAGGQWDGTRRLKGGYRGKLFEWLRYARWADQYVETETSSNHH